MNRFDGRRLASGALAAGFVIGCASAPYRTQAALPSRGAPIIGAFALRNATARTAEALRVESHGPLRATVDISETHSGAPLRYDIAMTKEMHCIVVSDDFVSFQHLHPVLAENGHFRLDLRVPKAGRYHVYADTQPHGIGQQVFRYTIRFPGAATSRVRAAPAARAVRSGPYTVELATLTVTAGGPTALPLTIRKAGKTATDLRPYLGGAAHAVFIDAANLDYLHVHPMTNRALGATRPVESAMDGMAMEETASAPSEHVYGALALHVALRRGAYRLFVQFRGADGLHVAPFVLRAR